MYGPDELEGECNLRYACAMGREVLDAGGKALRVGVTTDEIDRVVHEVRILLHFVLFFRFIFSGLIVFARIDVFRRRVWREIATHLL